MRLICSSLLEDSNHPYFTYEKLRLKWKNNLSEVKKNDEFNKNTITMRRPTIE